eukprot:jgi/Mesen1/683/ME000109S_10901
MAAATLGCHYIPGSFLASPSTNSKSLRNGNRQTVQLGGINRKLFRGLKVGSLKKNNEEQRRSFIMASQEPNTEGHGGAMKVVNTGDGGSKLVIDHDKEKELRGQGGHSNNSSHSNGLHNGSSSRNQESKFVGELASESAVEGPKGLHSTAEHDVKEMEPSARNGGLEKKVQHLEDEAVRLSDKAAKDFMSGQVSVPREEAGNTFQHRTKEGIQVDAGLPGQAERERQKLSDETSRGLGKAGDKAQDVGDKARGATQEVKERLPEDAQRATDRVGEKAEELGDKAKGAAQDVKERLPESAQRATDKAGEKAEELGDNTKGAARTVGHKAEQLGEKAKGAAREVQDCLPDGAKAATQKVGREAEKLGDRTKEQVEHVKEEMPDNAREAGVKARQTTEHAAEEVKGGLSEVMEHVVNPLAQAVKEVITDPGSLFHPNAGHEDEHKHKK